VCLSQCCQKTKRCIPECELNGHKHVTLTWAVKTISGSNGRDPEPLQLHFPIEPWLLPYNFVLSHLITFEYPENRNVLAERPFLLLISKFDRNLCCITLWDLKLE